MKKVMLVFGTRPEAIKMAPLVKELKKHTDYFQTIVCVTIDLNIQSIVEKYLKQAVEKYDCANGGNVIVMDPKTGNILGMANYPDYDLNIMQQGQDLYDVTSRVLLGLRDVLKLEQPDVVLVHGDTTTSTSAALAAFYQQILVGHVEAGLRTYNIYSPWPEELNRQITSRIASFHFAPTELSKENLLLENISDKNIFITGNTVIDALHIVLEKIKTDSSIKEKVKEELHLKGLSLDLIESWENGHDFVLITGHRRENFGEGFMNICHGIKELAEKYPDVDFLYPMHLNPNVRKPIKEVFGEDYLAESNVYFIEPLEYLPFVFLMSLAKIVLTDSGGIQEEAPGLGKPVLVMRDTTERPEAVSAGTVKLVGTNKDKIVSEMSKLLDDSNSYNMMSSASNPYGNGNSSNLIVGVLKKYFYNE